MANIRNAIVAADQTEQPSRAVAPPAGQAGDSYVVFQIADNDTALANMTAPAGQNFTERASAGVLYCPRLKVWTRPYDGSEPASWTFRNDPSAAHQNALVAMALSDIDLDALLVGTPATASTPPQTTGTVFPVPAMTVDQVGQLSVVFGAGLIYNAPDAGGAFFTPPTTTPPWTEYLDLGQSWMKPVLYARRAAATGSTGDPSATLSKALTQGRAVMHVLFSEKVAAPSGPEPGRAMLAA